MQIKINLKNFCIVKLFSWKWTYIHYKKTKKTLLLHFFAKMKKIAKILVLFGILFISINSYIFASDRDLPWITIISRAERWADENWRLVSHPKWQWILANRLAQQKSLDNLRENDYLAYLKKIAESDRAKEKSNTANSFLKKNFYDDMYTDRSNSLFNWQKLWWTEYHRNQKTKILIHHTASDNTNLKTQDDVLTYLQDVYKYHTLINARWDIGYNFIIDPFGNIYEGRAGWEWVIWAHTKRNNTPSIWIAMIWNFEDNQPSKQALESLIKLIVALVKKYNINPNWTTHYHKDLSTSPYVQSSVNYTIAWHKDAGNTACPWENLHKLLPYIRSSVDDIINWKSREITDDIGLQSQKHSTHFTPTKKNSTKLTYEYIESIQPKISPAITQIKKDYISQNNITSATNYTTKILWKISLEQAKALMQQNIRVLLYELTQNYDLYTLICDWWCTFSFDKNTINSDSWEIFLWVWNTLALNINDETYTSQTISVSSKNNLITVSNYDRKSYAWIPRNSFHWSLIFQKDYFRDKNWNQSYKNVVINRLSFADYMKWIVETNDTETSTKNEVMALISKSYALFYMNPANHHPNIPDQANYNAVDDPDIFQKYVWAWLEKTLTKRYQALKNTEDKIILYNWYVPVLPYFSCSAGFTYSAYEKRWRNDTSYLQSKFDIWICADKKFSWHGVWLSWLGAERWAKTFGRSYTDILKYYYPWVQIVNL